VPAIFAPGLVVRVMFGGGYEAAEDGVLPAVLAGAGLSLLLLLATYSVAIRDRRWVVLLVGGVTLQATTFVLLHASAVQMAWAQAGVIVAILLANESFFRRLLSRSA
jgi:hypothetical protein